MITIAYDGSTDAEAAVARTAALMPGSITEVVTVWEPILSALSRSGSMGTAMAYSPDSSEAFDTEAQARALATATAGAAIATAAGLVATPRSVERRSNVAQSILRAAEQSGSAAIVVGSRGAGDVKSLVLGSVAHAVVQHAAVPVLVVPSDRVAAQRRVLVEEDSGAAASV